MKDNINQEENDELMDNIDLAFASMRFKKQLEENPYTYNDYIRSKRNKKIIYAILSMAGIGLIILSINFYKNLSDLNKNDLFVENTGGDTTSLERNINDTILTAIDTSQKTPETIKEKPKEKTNTIKKIKKPLIFADIIKDYEQTYPFSEKGGQASSHDVSSMPPNITNQKWKEAIEYYDNQKYNDAATVVDNILEYNPGMYYVRLMKANILYLNKDYENAKVELDLIINKASTDEVIEIAIWLKGLSLIHLKDEENGKDLLKSLNGKFNTDELLKKLEPQ